MARRDFNPGALTAPLPPVLVTCGDMEKANIITIGWTGILNTKPPMTYISVRPSRFSYNIIKEKGEFVINLPPASLVREVDLCGIKTGGKIDKFKTCNLTPVESKELAAPSIKECPVSLECRVKEIMELGSHHVFIADIVNVSADEGIIDENGRLCFERADLMAYIHGEYYSIGKKIGKFGFSVTKKKKPNKPKKDDKSKG